MALNIKNATTERLAHELARATGASLTEAVTIALRERLDAVRRRRCPRAARRGRGDPGARACAAGPRSAHPEELLGYDEHGLPR